MDTSRDDRQAKQAIKDGCVCILQDGVPWYDTEWLINCESLAWEVKYLRMRGLLVHHPLIQKLVRMKE